jgi:hypothetical protein
MILNVPEEFIAELEGAVEAGSLPSRARMLQQVTQLFASSANRLNERQISVFDHVLVRLIDRVETRTLVRLSMILSDLTSTPREAVRRLAWHENDLIEIAGHGGQQHLLAISGRKTLNEAITDAILKRAETTVCRILAMNAGARFSQLGYSKLVAAAERDDAISDGLIARPDLPSTMLQELLSGATEAARARLLRIASPELRGTIQSAIDRMVIQACTKAREPIDYSEAKSSVLALNHAGNLSDSAVSLYAVHRQHTHLVAALSLLADATIDIIEPLMEEHDCGGLVVACRASRLNWQTTLTVINSRGHPPGLSQQQLAQKRMLFESLPLSVAQRTIRFGSPRELVKPGLTDNDFVTARAS